MNACGVCIFVLVQDVDVHIGAGYIVILVTRFTRTLEERMMIVDCVFCAYQFHNGSWSG